jgi:hypothetical protein
MLFTTNRRGFALEKDALGPLEAEEITEEITPPDFAMRPRLRGFRIAAGNTRSGFRHR